MPPPARRKKLIVLGAAGRLADEREPGAVRQRVDRARLAGVRAARERDLGRAGRRQVLEVMRRGDVGCVLKQGHRVATARSNAGRIAAFFARPAAADRAGQRDHRRAAKSMKPLHDGSLGPRRRHVRRRHGVRRRSAAESRSREGAANRNRSLRRLPRRRRQQHRPGEPQARRTDPRVPRETAR